MKDNFLLTAIMILYDCHHSNKDKICIPEATNAFRRMVLNHIKHKLDSWRFFKWAVNK